MKKALKYAPDDNVITALEQLEPGDEVSVDGQVMDFKILDTVPVGHKIACQDIPLGGYIMKFNTHVAKTTEPVKKGNHIHTHNVSDLIAEWREHYSQNYVVKEVKELGDEFVLKNPPKLYGYKRKNGEVGFRNHLVVISTVICANQVVDQIGAKFFDEVIALPQPSGCVILPNEREQIRDVLLALARNNNVGAVIFVGLGCEDLDAKWMADQITDKPTGYVRIQDAGFSMEAVDQVSKMIKEMKAELDKQEREEVPLSSLVMGTKCGGSDWTSSCVSNPTVGYASDLLVKAGGTSLLGETQGWFGGQGILLARARTQETANKILGLLNRIYDKALAVGRRIEEGNPSIGNKAGGITTLNEKALGNVKKGGTAPIEGALDMAEKPRGKGLFVLDNPSLDPISVLGLTASGANVVLFTTGRGSPTGTPLAPVIKISGSPKTCQTFATHIEADLSKVVTGEVTLEEAGLALFNKMIAVANGELTSSEKYGHREFTMPMLMGTL